MLLAAFPAPSDCMSAGVRSTRKASSGRRRLKGVGRCGFASSITSMMHARRGADAPLVVTPLGGTVGDITGRNKEATMTAPLQMIALSFSRDAGSEDRILAEVDRLRGRGVLRLLDMLFVAKSQDGAIERLAIGDDEDFGSLLAAVVPVANGGPAAPAPTGGPAFDPADALALADSLQPGTALAFLLVEHHWAAPLFDAIAEAGGTLIGEGFLTSEAGQVVGAEVAALEEASQVIAQAQAAEADALLAAVAARAEAAEAGAGSEGGHPAAAAPPPPAPVT